MVGISRFWEPEKKSSALVKASFEKWRFKVVEKELGGQSSISYGIIVLWENAWHTTNYQDTEFHVSEWIDSLVYIKDATEEEIQIYHKYSELIDDLVIAND